MIIELIAIYEKALYMVEVVVWLCKNDLVTWHGRQNGRRHRVCLDFFVSFFIKKKRKESF
jgi:hypothetical protein